MSWSSSHPSSHPPAPRRPSPACCAPSARTLPEFYSLCEHHLLPFHGRAHVAYLPSRKVIGLSKIPRLLEVFSRRLQVQERLTEQTAQALEEVLEPRGVAVMLEAVHFCMLMRGVEKQQSTTSTFAFLGRFDSSPDLRAEFLAAVRGAPPAEEPPTRGRRRPYPGLRSRFRAASGRPRGHRCGLCPA